MNLDEYPNSAFLFKLHLVCGGYAYFSTFSGWIKHNAQDREVREPDKVNFWTCVTILGSIDIKPLYVKDSSSYNYWLARRGWALLEESFAQDEMQNWLEPRPCITDALGSYTDTTIADPAVLRPRTSIMRETVLKRNGCRCLSCGKWSEFDNEITMHHVKAFSRGGETTSRNLVPLCTDCNQKLG